MMPLTCRIIFFLLMSSALILGYADLFGPKDFAFDFERLHIFLFNLCSGGTIIVYYTEGRRNPGPAGISFLVLAVGYALLAFYESYLPALLIGFVLAAVVELVRIRRFSWNPASLLSATVSVQSKFHHASLICLSLALISASLVIANNEFYHWLDMAKLQLNTFFLGFSFPVSLISMSVIFSQMNSLAGEKADKPMRRLVDLLQESCFWTINLGVIIFFIFILLEKLVFQVVIASILFCAVMLTYSLYRTLGTRLQQKHFLTSGILFLVGTAITGILYIILAFSPTYEPEKYKYLLRIHAFLSLYGWNLSGLAVLIRRHEFPIELHSGKLVALHWLTVVLLCPLGRYNQFFAVAAVCCYIFILQAFFFRKGRRDAGLSELGI